jgi:hypothetical protein
MMRWNKVEGMWCKITRFPWIFVVGVLLRAICSLVCYAASSSFVLLGLRQGANPFGLVVKNWRVVLLGCVPS